MGNTFEELNATEREFVAEYLSYTDQDVFFSSIRSHVEGIDGPHPMIVARISTGEWVELGYRNSGAIGLIKRKKMEKDELTEKMHGDQKEYYAHKLKEQEKNNEIQHKQNHINKEHMLTQTKQSNARYAIQQKLTSSIMQSLLEQQVSDEDMKQQLQKRTGEQSAKIVWQREHKKELKCYGIPEEVSEFTKENYNKYLNLVKNLDSPPRTQTMSIAFIGEASSGKTSTINALFNTNLKTSVFANTLGNNVVHSEGGSDGYQIYDIYGTNDEESYHALDEQLKIKQLHYIVLIIGTSFVYNINQYKQLSQLSNKVIIVRNKVEMMSADDLKQSHEECLIHFGSVFKLFHIVACPDLKQKYGLNEISDLMKFLVNLSPRRSFINEKNTTPQWFPLKKYKIN